MNPETLLSRVRARCTHPPEFPGFCVSCFQWVMAEMLVEENSELCMDDAINVESEWLLRAGREFHRSSVCGSRGRRAALPTRKQNSHE